MSFVDNGLQLALKLCKDFVIINLSKDQGATWKHVIFHLYLLATPAIYVLSPHDSRRWRDQSKTAPLWQYSPYEDF